MEAEILVAKVEQLKGTITFNNRCLYQCPEIETELRQGKDIGTVVRTILESWCMFYAIG